MKKAKCIGQREKIFDRSPKHEEYLHHRLCKIPGFTVDTWLPAGPDRSSDQDRDTDSKHADSIEQVRAKKPPLVHREIRVDVLHAFLCRKMQRERSESIIGGASDEEPRHRRPEREVGSTDKIIRRPPACQEKQARANLIHDSRHSPEETATTTTKGRV